MNLFYSALNSTLNARQRSMPERPLDPPDTGRLTTAEENGIQAALEQLAEDEATNCTEKFQDWLNSGKGKRARQDYAQHRVATATDDERAKLLADL